MKAPITPTQAWAVIAESAGWNAKELPVLPELDQEDQQWLTDNPNTSDIVAFIRGYTTGHGLKCAAQARKLALMDAIKQVTILYEKDDYPVLTDICNLIATAK